MPTQSGAAPEVRSLQVDCGEAVRHLYLQQHADGAADETQDSCAVFVCGLPFSKAPLAGWLTELLQPFGAVRQAVLHPSQASAIVVFEEAAAWRAICRGSREGLLLNLELPQPAGPVGLRGWVEAHKQRFPGTAALKQQLDAWLTQHEAQQAQAASSAQAPDDGWTLVRRRGGRRKTTDAEGTAVGAVAAAAAQTKHGTPKDNLKQDFYRYQKRESQRNELMELQKGFERDQKRIAELRQARRFKPY